MRTKEYWKRWLIAAMIRALKTFAQSVVTLIGTQAVGITALDWPQIAAVSATTSVVSIATSIAGLPEVKVSDPEELRAEEDVK